MQPHQYALAAGIIWLATLLVLPILIAKVHRHAYDEGFVEHQHKLNSYSAALNEDISHLVAAREEDQRKHNLTVANLKRTIAELEARIMSYTGMAVTRSDYERLLSTAEALRLAQRLHMALKAGAQADRASELATAADEIAKRIHAHLRATPASAPKAEAAA